MQQYITNGTHAGEQFLNDMILVMKLTVLGSGTSVPHPERSSSAYWVETAGGTLLLDCSPTAAHRMAEESLPWHELDVIWISHFHLDHCGGLAPFLFSAKHAPDTRSRVKPLRIFGPSGLRDLMNAFDSANNYGSFDQRFPVEIVEVAALEKFSILDGIDAVAMKTPHTPESHAIHLTNSDGSTMVFTSDTGYDRRLAAFARRVDLLLIECSFVRDKPVQKHLELLEALDIIRRAEPRQTILTHLYPEWDHEDVDALLAEFAANTDVELARDGLSITL